MNMHCHSAKSELTSHGSNSCICGSSAQLIQKLQTKKSAVKKKKAVAQPGFSVNKWFLCNLQLFHFLDGIIVLYEAILILFFFILVTTKILFKAGKLGLSSVTLLLQVAYFSIVSQV